MATWQPAHRTNQDSVSSLAYGLSPVLTLRLQASFLLSGLADASQYKKAIESIQSNPHIRASLTKCSLLQAFILLCVLGADYLLLPAWTRGSASSASGRTRMDPESARFYFQLFWLYPLLGLSFLVSGSFFSNVASRANSGEVPMVSSSRSSRIPSGSAVNQSSLISRSLIIAVYLLISAVISRIPFIGRPSSFLYVCIVSSYYCFEYRFISTEGLTTIRERVRFLESRWTYFIGFGVPSTILSSSLFSSPTVNLAIWSLLFPLFLLMAAYSDPLPYDPAFPAKLHDLPGQEFAGSNKNRGTTKFANENLNPDARLPDWWPVRIPVLYLAVLLDDLVSGFVGGLLRSSGGSSGPKKSAEGYSGAGVSPANYGAAAYGYGGPASAGGNSGPNGQHYAQRRDAYNTSLRNLAASAHPQQQATSSLQSGFARQAESFFGNNSSASTFGGTKFGSSSNGMASSKPKDGFGVGNAAGVSMRREDLGASTGNSGVQSRRRAAGSDL